jgi:hypothetical protein
MYEDCGRTGCAGGGGTFLFAVFAVWLVISWVILFKDATSIKGYIKEIPERIIIFGFISAIFFGIGWVVSKLGL